MTINGSENMTMKDNLGHKVDNRCNEFWCITEGKLYSSATMFAKSHNMSPRTVFNAMYRGATTIGGLKVCYKKNVTKTQNTMADEINELKAQVEALKADAELGRKVRLEQEEARKAEEKRAEAIAKAEAKVERRQRMYDRKMEDAKNAYTRLMEAKNELAKLKGDN